MRTKWMSNAHIFLKVGNKALFRAEYSLKRAVQPLYAELAAKIAQQQGGMKFLVDMRGDLLVR